MPRYFAAPGSPFSDEDAAEIGPELQMLAESGCGSPSDIVEYAKRSETPLRRHLHLDRPLEDIAESWYKHRAGVCARSILLEVVVDGHRQAVRAFHSVTVVTFDPIEDREPIKRTYVTLEMARQSEAIASQIVDDACRRLRTWARLHGVYRDVLTKAHPELAVVFEFCET